MKKLSSSRLTAIPLLAALAMAGCGKTQVESVNDTGSEISFNAVVGKQTVSRAKEFGYWQPGQTLNVVAYQTGTTSAAYNNFTLNYYGTQTTSWSYNPSIDVPPFSLSYYAYYPSTANISNLSTDGMGGTFSYTVPNPQEDLVAAKTITSYARVALMFYHTLSQVNFAIQGMQGVKITVSNISVNAVSNSGLYTFNPTGGTWSGLSGSTAYPYNPLDTVVFPTSGDSNDIIYFGNKGGNSPTDNDNSNALMLLPQTFASGTGGNITFNYSLTDMNDIVLKSGSAKTYLGDFTTNKWEMGKRYLYLIDFSGLMETGPITFEAIVFGWSDAMQNIAQPVWVADITKVLIEQAITSQGYEKASVPSLTVFPISLPEAGVLGVNDTIVLKDFDGTHFVTGDQVRIQCNSDYIAQKISLDPSILDTEWSMNVSETVVTLIKL